jgi:hypothetical protein
MINIHTCPVSPHCKVSCFIIIVTSVYHNISDLQFARYKELMRFKKVKNIYSLLFNNAQKRLIIFCRKSIGLKVGF